MFKKKSPRSKLRGLSQEQLLALLRIKLHATLPTYRSVFVGKGHGNPAKIFLSRQNNWTNHTPDFWNLKQVREYLHQNPAAMAQLMEYSK